MAANRLEGENMANFFVEKGALINERVNITGSEAAHMIKTLRMREGDSLTLFDGDGNCAEAELESVSQKEAYARILRRYRSDTEPKLKITLFQAIPKNPKMDFIVQKAVEIGVCEIVPVRTKRIVAKMDKDSKTERLRKIALEAAKQCGRAFLPKVHEPMDFKAALEMAQRCEKIIIPYESEKEGSIKDALDGGVSSCAIFIGPEGGFEESEVAEALSFGAKKITLGKRILRTETAGLIASALCLYTAGDMG